MDSIDPADLSPLSFGAGLAFGLLLILGLPRAGVAPQSRLGRETAFELRMPLGRQPAPIATRDSVRQPPGLAAAEPR